MNDHRPTPSPLQNELKRVVRRHLPDVTPWENRLKRHFDYKVPHVSVLAKMASYDRDAVIAYWRFKMLEEISDIRSGYHYNHRSRLSRLKAGLSRVEKISRAFAEAIAERLNA